MKLIEIEKHLISGGKLRSTVKKNYLEEICTEKPLSVMNVAVNKSM